MKTQTRRVVKAGASRWLTPEVLSRPLRWAPAADGRRLLVLLTAALAKHPDLSGRLAARLLGGRWQVVVFRREAASPTLVSIDAVSFEAAREMLG